MERGHLLDLYGRGTDSGERIESEVVFSVILGIGAGFSAQVGVNFFCYKPRVHFSVCLFISTYGWVLSIPLPLFRASLFLESIFIPEENI